MDLFAPGPVEHVAHEIGTRSGERRCAEPFCERELQRVALGHEDRAVEAQDAAQRLQEEQPRRSGSEDQDVPGRARVGQAVARPGARGALERVQHAGERLAQRDFVPRQIAFDPEGVDRRDRDVLGEPPLDSRDAVLAVVQTLVTVAACTVFAGRLDALAAAAQTLVDQDPVAHLQITHLAPDLFHHP